MDATELRQLVRDANPDLEQRVKLAPLLFQYDSGSDVLYFEMTDYKTLVPVVSVESVDPESTVSLRVEDETWKLLGFDIVEWRETFLPANPEFGAWFEPLVKAVGTGDFKIEFDPASGGDDADLRIYVPQQVEEVLSAAA